MNNINKEISIIIPVWNEEKWIENCYKKINNFLVKTSIDSYIVFASDGCTDNTPTIISKIAKNDAKVIHFNDDNKLGRGLALKNTFRNLNTKYLIYMDSDLATDLKYVNELIKQLENGADIVTGSRLLKDSCCERKFKRTLFSRIYNFLARLLFRSKIKDHQCGFKGFKRESVMELVEKIESNGWFWDTELIIKAQKAKLNVVEIPVSWKDRATEESKVNVWKDAKNMGINLVKLRWKLLPIFVKQFLKFGIVGAINTGITLSILWLLDSTIGRGSWGYPLAYGVGTIPSFFLNRLFTFEQKKWHIKAIWEFINFGLVVLFGLCFYTIIATLFEELLGMHYIFAAIIGTLLNFILQFILAKFLVFTKKNNEKIAND